MITRFNLDDLAKNLPDAYRKDPASVNSRILRIEKYAMDDLRAMLRSIDDSLDLNLATGATLDLYGDMIGQQRGKATDAQYRALIKMQIVRNFVTGGYNSVVELLAMILGCAPSEIVLTEDDETRHVRVDNLPFEKLNEMALDAATVTQIIKEIIPMGIYLEGVSFAGTFKFSDGPELVYNAAAGFADDAQTIGGYFGYMFGGEDTEELPVQ